MKRQQRSAPTRPRSNGNAKVSIRARADSHNGAVTVLTAQFKRIVTHMTQMQSELDYVKRAWEMMGTSRQGVREQIERDRADLDVQFTRIATMQAEIDRLKANEASLHAEIDRLRIGRSR